MGTFRAIGIAMRGPRSPLLASGLAIVVGLVATATPAMAQGHTIPDPKEILALDDRLKNLVDEHVTPSMTKAVKVRSLMNLMYNPDKLGLVYQAAETRTAIETVDNGGGNCVSLANTLVALGRYAGLKVDYISARLEENWQRQGDYLLVSRHTTARVEVDAGAFVTIEFEWIIPRGEGRYDVISDERAFAEFYSNLAVDLMGSGDTAGAIAYLQRALEVDPEFASAWNNLGVVYRRAGQVENAEEAYKRALRRDRSNLSAMINLELLYRNLGRQEKAEKYQKRLERYRRRNPYYLIELAEECIAEGDYTAAVKFAKRAIRRRKSEHHFYFVLARAYAHTDRSERCERSLEKAFSRAPGEDSRARYQQKLELVRQGTG